jgi:hypothetical protein
MSTGHSHHWASPLPIRAVINTCGYLIFFHLIVCSLASASAADDAEAARWKQQFEGAVR